MPQRLAMGQCVVGARSLVRAIEEGSVRVAYLGNDADLFIRRKVEDACRAHNIPLVEETTMEELGRLCKCPVPAAAAGLKK
ncbi:MAG: ribosomal L7Ae/L30e/S12e/Gadd45 family protein [Eubacteriales bacterium]|nr:ribosomal L7Ae/L30e/S12e/Gadd45 family protein [Eubacteriales bacterium]